MMKEGRMRLINIGIDVNFLWGYFTLNNIFFQNGTTSYYLGRM